MKRLCIALGTLALLLVPAVASAQDKLVVSIWGGSWRDIVAETRRQEVYRRRPGCRSSTSRAAPSTGSTRQKLAKGNPESDITFTTSHVGWLYANDGLFEKLDLNKMPNARNLLERRKISPYHLGTWAYVYTIGYRARPAQGREIRELERSVEA